MNIMGRRKIEISPIRNRKNRHVTFFKRKNGLFKKVQELGTLCSCKAMAIVFFEGQIYDVTSTGEQMPDLFDEYTRIICADEPPNLDLPIIEGGRHDFNKVMECLWVSYTAMLCSVMY